RLGSMAGPIVKEIGASITGNSATILRMSPPGSASSRLRTQVAIVGAGPAGLLLGQLLHRAGIDAIVIEQRSREYVLGRVPAGAKTVYEAQDVAVHDFETDRPSVSWKENNVLKTVQCDFIAGCDGFHGVCRASVPADKIQVFEKVYAFGWLGFLSDTPPLSEE